MLHVKTSVEKKKKKKKKKKKHLISSLWWNLLQKWRSTLDTLDICLFSKNYSPAILLVRKDITSIVISQIGRTASVNNKFILLNNWNRLIIVINESLTIGQDKTRQDLFWVGEKYNTKISYWTFEPTKFKEIYTTDCLPSHRPNHIMEGSSPVARQWVGPRSQWLPRHKSFY